MAFTNQTTHYGLPLPIGSDKSTWLDNNAAFAAIDAAIYQASTDAAAAAGDITTIQSDITSLQSGKQNVLTFDAAPTMGSTNPVTSGGVFDALKNVTLLYTNPNPTVDMGSGNITVSDMSEYDLILTIARFSKNSNTDLSCVSIKGEDLMLITNDNGPSGAGTVQRLISYVNATTLTVGDANAAYGTTPPVTSNNILIPYKIYGIKL